MPAAHRAGFGEQHHARDVLGFAGAITAGVLLIILGRGLRAVDDNLADFFLGDLD